MRDRAKIPPPWFFSFWLYCFLIPQPTLAAAGDENWDTQFGAPGANGPVFAISVVGNDVYFGGAFSSIGGINVSNIARWDGTQWHSVGAGLSGRVTALLASGNILYVAGGFTDAGGVAATNIARWDGTNWSALGMGINGTVSALAVLGDDLFVGGSLNSAGQLAVSNIAQWDGMNWSDVGGGLNGPVGVLLSIGSTLYVGGAFTKAGISTATNIATWDRTNWLALGDGLSVSPSAIAGSSSSLFAYSMSSSYVDETRFMISRWDGTSWQTSLAGEFAPPCFDCYARAGGMAINGNDIYIGGLFSRVIPSTPPGDATPANCVAKWDGTNWTGLGSGLFSISLGSVAVAATGSELFLGGRFGGRFGTAGGTSSQNIALWHIPHALSASCSGDILTLSWPATGTNFVLEASNTLQPTSWSEIYDVPILIGDQLVVTNSISATTRYFRLRRQ